MASDVIEGLTRDREAMRAEVEAADVAAPSSPPLSQSHRLMIDVPPDRSGLVPVPAPFRPAERA